MINLTTVKTEIQKEINLTINFFSEIDLKAKQQKEIAKRVEQIAFDQEAELMAIFNQISN